MFESKTQTMQPGVPFSRTVNGTFFILQSAYLTTTTTPGGNLIKTPVNVRVRIFRRRSIICDVYVSSGFQFSDQLGFDEFELTSSQMFYGIDYACTYTIGDGAQEVRGRFYGASGSASTFSAGTLSVPAGTVGYVPNLSFYASTCTKIILNPNTPGIKLVHVAGTDGVNLPSGSNFEITYPESMASFGLRNTSGGVIYVDFGCWLLSGYTPNELR